MYKMRSWRQITRALHLFTCSNHKVPPKPMELPRSDCAALLTHRAVVRVQGDDAGQLLQGLITADVLSASPAQYSMMLNPQGRVLYDIILYKTSDSGYLLECDNRATDEVVRHLKKYALRSKVRISQADSEYDLWSLFPGTPSEPSSEGAVTYHSDPRLSELGTRALTQSGAKATDMWKNVVEESLDFYHKFRLQHGIAEGIDEIPPGNCFPLEYNLDYLNGVSFHKGCYVGQELTARTHHTGVIRKRVMPITLEESLCGKVLPATTITSSSGKNVGKFICHNGLFGLALLRVQQVLDVNVSLSVKTSDEQDVNVTTKKPSWWLL